MKKIEAVIFDWAGTTVDYGCFAPVSAFIEAFKMYGIEPTMKEVREPMGMAKEIMFVLCCRWSVFLQNGRSCITEISMKMM